MMSKDAIGIVNIKPRRVELRLDDFQPGPRGYFEPAYKQSTTGLYLRKKNTETASATSIILNLKPR